MIEYVKNPKGELHNPGNIQKSDGGLYDYHELPARLVELGKAAKLFGSAKDCADFGWDPIKAVHSDAYVEYLRNTKSDRSLFGNRTAVFADNPPMRIGEYEKGTDCASTTMKSFSSKNVKWAQDDFTPLMKDTPEAIYWSAQCAINGAHSILEKGGIAYALCRPPGHHANRDSFGGYCYFNNAAIAAHVLSRAGKTAVLDIDAHHGNGTQNIFYDNPRVFTCSVHGDPSWAYPYRSGHASERGVGAGLGTNLNIPLRQGTADDAYLFALEKGLHAIRKFNPNSIVISLGMDISQNDPNQYFNITEEGFKRIASLINETLRSTKPVPMLIVQEGGYNLKELKPLLKSFLSGFREF